MRKTIIIFALFVASIAHSFAQGGSNYSIFGIGDIQQSVVARYESLAGTSIAIPSEYAINPRNPALWANVKNTRIQAGYNYNLRHIEQGLGTMFQSNATVNHILGIFSIDTSLGLSAAFGILPYSSVNYLIKKQERIFNEDFNIYGESTYEGNGGVSQGFLGASVKPLNWLQLGLSINTFFGRLNQNINTIFFDYKNQNQTNRRSTIIRGNSVKAGMTLQPFNNFNIGLFYDKVLNYRNEIEIAFDGSDNYVKNDTSYSQFYEHKLPDTYGVGVSYQMDNYLIGADISMQDFTNFQLNKTDRFVYTNSYSASLGLSRIGQGGFRRNIFDKTTYNFGLGYKQLYYKVFGQDIKEYYASVGFDVPVTPVFWINSAFTFGVRGVNQNNAIKETFFKLNVNLSIGETWFQRFIEEY